MLERLKRESRAEAPARSDCYRFVGGRAVPIDAPSVHGAQEPSKAATNWTFLVRRTERADDETAPPLDLRLWGSSYSHAWPSQR